MNDSLYKLFSNLLLLLLLNSYLCQSQQGDYFRLQNVIYTGINLTKALAVSPTQDYFIVGATDGTLNVYNYKYGTLQKSTNQLKTEIFDIVWENDRQGLITVSIDSATNKSTAVIRSTNTFQQVKKWQFDEVIYSVDTTYTETVSYVAFNLFNRVQEYNIRYQNLTTTYRAFGGQRIMQIAYTPNYQYIYLIQSNQYLYVLKCGQSYGYAYAGMGFLSSLQSDKYNSTNDPVIYKSTFDSKSHFYVFDLLRFVSSNFSQQISMKQYKYCPKDYIIGLSEEQKIYIFSKDYNFTLYGQIDEFFNNKIQILDFECQHGHLIVSAINNKVYIYELKPFNDLDEINWIRLWVLIGTGVVIFVLISIFVYKKIKRNRQLKQKANKSQLIQSLQTSTNSINEEIQ